MRWKTERVKFGEIVTVKGFAWLKVKGTDGYTYWLQSLFYTLKNIKTKNILRGSN